jgi:hypothetical protein
MNKWSFLFVPTAAAILAGCSAGSGTEGSSETRRIEATAEIQREGIRYFEITAPSSEEKVLTAFGAKDDVVFSVDYVDAPGKQKMITLTGPHVYRSWLRPELQPAAPAKTSIPIHIHLSRECGYYYRELVIAFVTNDWEDFGFWADSISAFCGEGPLVS